MRGAIDTTQHALDDLGMRHRGVAHQLVPRRRKTHRVELAAGDHQAGMQGRGDRHWFGINGNADRARAAGSAYRKIIGPGHDSGAGIRSATGAGIASIQREGDDRGAGNPAGGQRSTGHVLQRQGRNGGGWEGRGAVVLSILFQGIQVAAGQRRHRQGTSTQHHGFAEIARGFDDRGFDQSGCGRR